MIFRLEAVAQEVKKHIPFVDCFDLTKEIVTSLSLAWIQRTGSGWCFSQAPLKASCKSLAIIKLARAIVRDWICGMLRR